MFLCLDTEGSKQINTQIPLGIHLVCNKIPLRQGNAKEISMCLQPFEHDSTQWDMLP